MKKQALKGTAQSLAKNHILPKSWVIGTRSPTRQYFSRQASVEFVKLGMSPNLTTQLALPNVRMSTTATGAKKQYTAAAH